MSHHDSASNIFHDSTTNHGSIDFHPTHIDSHGISGHVEASTQIDNHWTVHVGFDGSLSSGHSGIDSVSGGISYNL
jgi:hypothetical protein